MADQQVQSQQVNSLGAALWTGTLSDSSTQHGPANEPALSDRDPAQHVQGARNDDLLKLQVRDAVGLSTDPHFVGMMQGMSPDYLRVLVTVIEPSIQPYRKGRNVWLSAATVHAISNTQVDKVIKATKRAARQQARSTEQQERNNTTSVDDQTIGDNEMATKSKTSKSKGAKGTTSKASSNGKAKTEKSKRVTVITKDALAALPATLRAGIVSNRLNWVEPPFKEPKLIKFDADCPAGAYKSGGHIWGYTKLADKEFKLFWHWHYQMKSDGTAVANRALSFKSVEAAQHQARYEAVYLGVKEPEHFSLTF